MEDEQIVNLFWNRREEAIAAASEKYETYLTAAAYRVLADREDSRECVNETYWKAWNSIPPNRPQNLGAYLSKITRQLAIDCWRSKKSLKRSGSAYALSLSELGDIAEPGRDPETEYEARRLDEAIRSFLRELPEEERQLFIGRYYFFDPMKEVARYCGMGESRAKSMLYRTRKKLREYLCKEGFAL